MANEKQKELQIEAAAPANPIPPNEVLSKSAMEILARASQNDLIAPDPTAELIRASANESGCWVHSPATIQLFAIADERLTRLANSMGMNLKEVERVHVRLVNGSKLVIIIPAPSGDRSALPVRRYDGQSAAYINIVSLLGPKKLSVKPGWRERFDITYVPSGFAVGPGLIFDLANPIERRQVSKKEEEQGTAPAATTTKRTKAAKAPKPATASTQPPTPAGTEPTQKEEGAGQK